MALSAANAKRQIDCGCGPTVRVWKDTTRWLVDPVEHERRLVTLLARLDVNNQAFLDFYLMPGINRRTRLRISSKDPWLKRGMPLRDLSQLCKLISRTPFAGSSR